MRLCVSPQGFLNAASTGKIQDSCLALCCTQCLSGFLQVDTSQSQRTYRTHVGARAENADVFVLNAVANRANPLRFDK